MDRQKAKVIHFLESHGMGDNIAVDALLENFIEDMESGLRGETKSLLMIPTYMEIGKSVPIGEPIIVMDAGGTNFRVALVTFGGEREAQIDHFAKYPMPGTEKRIDKETFLNTVVDYMEPVLGKSNKVGFCFSFPTEILPDGDGRLIGFNKEIEVDGSAGMVVGESLNAVLESRGLERKRFILLNDTVAAMFSGIGSQPGKSHDSYIGLILGTGTNTCYIEEKKHIAKVAESDGYMAINMESGGYDGMCRGEYDKALDAATNNPGDHQYEKMVSGAYRGDLIYRTLRGAAGAGLFSPAFADFLAGLNTLSLKDAGDFLAHPFGDDLLASAAKASEDDRRTLYYIIDSNFERVARLMTVNIGGILLKTGKGQDPTRPVCIIAEGTVFHSSSEFRRKLDYHIKKEIEEKYGHYCEFVGFDDATLIGTAVAGLMN